MTVKEPVKKKATAAPQSATKPATKPAPQKASQQVPQQAPQQAPKEEVQSSPEVEVEAAEEVDSPFVKTATLMQAKLLILMECPYIRKAQKKGLNYTFTSEADLINKLRPSMLRYGVVVAPIENELISDAEFTTRSGAVMRRVVVKITYRFTHVWSGQSEAVQMHGEGADVGDKAVNKAQTDALKYALRQWSMIETGDDPDNTPSDDYVRDAAVKAHMVEGGAQVTNGTTRAAAKATTSQNAPVRSGNNAYQLCVQALQGANSRESILTYQKPYREKRGFTPEQIAELDEIAERRGAFLDILSAIKRCSTIEKLDAEHDRFDGSRRDGDTFSDQELAEIADAFKQRESELLPEDEEPLPEEEAGDYPEDGEPVDD